MRLATLRLLMDAGLRYGILRHEASITRIRKKA